MKFSLKQKDKISEIEFLDFDTALQEFECQFYEDPDIHMIETVKLQNGQMSIALKGKHGKIISQIKTF